MNKQKLVHQLFIGKVADILGMEKTTELLKEANEAFAIHNVVGQSEQLKAFANYAQKRKWEDGDKDLSEFVDEFLSL